MPPALLLLAVLTACVPTDTGPTGAEDFATYCAACHGPLGMGDGELAGGLTKRPANLTGLTARNGGTFPATRVMAKIWGPAAAGQPGGSHALMPQFGPLLDSKLVPYDGGDGIATPTPLRLVQIADYLRGL
ncbi:MAG: c-type cytochrome, partial [Rhodobacteraceae bacterium]|nr:c-type cytochrome [Paracoccaceae bacterium]